MKYLFTMLCLSTLLVGCKLETENETTTAFDQVQKSQLKFYTPDSTSGVKLGWRFNTFDKELASRTCVYGDTLTEQGVNQGKLTSTIESTYEDVYQSMFGSIGLGSNIWAFEVSGNAAVAQSMASSSYSSTMTFSFNYSEKKEVLVPYSNGVYLVSSDCPSTTASGAPKFDVYGDAYVSAIQHGGKIAVLVKIMYASEEDKKKFSGDLRVGVDGAFNISGALKSANSATKKSVKILIEASQIGGDPAKLLSILGDGASVSCDLTNMSLCQLVVKNAIEYAKDEFRNDLTANGLTAVTGIFVNTYSDSLLWDLLDEEGIQQPNRVDKDVLADIDRMVKDNLAIVSRANNVLDQYRTGLTVSEQALVEELKSDALANSANLSALGAYCLESIPSSTSGLNIPGVIADDTYFDSKVTTCSSRFGDVVLNMDPLYTYIDLSSRTSILTIN